MTHDIFYPVIENINKEIAKSKCLETVFSKNDLFAIAGGFIADFFKSGDIKEGIITSGITGFAKIIGNIITGYKKPNLTGVDTFIYNKLRYKDKQIKK